MAGIGDTTDCVYHAQGGQIACSITRDGDRGWLPVGIGRRTIR